jgi:U4/U6.U5 tri-snRNP-associated protein 2
MLLAEKFSDDMLEKMSLFYKKLWSNKNFKGVISPHELMQAISDKSNKLFKIGKMSDPSVFFVWLINNT